MLDKNDLRLGNLVNFYLDMNKKTPVNSYHQGIITSLVDNGAVIDSKYNVKYCNLEGAPLTGELLIKFGFDKGSIMEEPIKLDTYTIEINRFIVFISYPHEDNNWYIGIEDNSNYYRNFTGFLKNIHELQNILYEVVKYELNIKN